MDYANANPPFHTTATVSGSTITNMINYGLWTGSGSSGAGNPTIYTRGNNTLANNGSLGGGGDTLGNIVAVAPQ